MSIAPIPLERSSPSQFIAGKNWPVHANGPAHSSIVESGITNAVTLGTPFALFVVAPVARVTIITMLARAVVPPVAATEVVAAFPTIRVIEPRPCQSSGQTRWRPEIPAAKAFLFP